jgi:hypothetical protein
MIAMLHLAALAIAAVVSTAIPKLDGTLVDPIKPQPGTRATVLLFVSSDCPISNRYAPDVRKMFDRYSKEGVAFWLVYPNPADAVSDIRDHIKQFSYPGTALRDVKHELVKRAGATITPEAVVYNGRGVMTYRGRLDDRYSAIGIEKAMATRHDLQDAIAATLAGKPIKDNRTQAVGCYIADFVK